MKRPSNWFFPTAFSAWGIEEAEAIKRVIAGDWFTYGDEVAAFEHELATYHGRRHAVMVNSGSSANLIAVAALFNVKDRPLKRGDKALVPAIAWTTTYSPIVQHGMDLILVDVDDGWNADPYAAGLDPQDARLVVGCSILGNPAPLADWSTVAGILDAYFIEDNAESLGASLNGKMCGTFGLMSTLSFFASHQISAIEGGAILTDDDECYRLCRMLRSHGWTRDVDPPQTFEDEYRFELFGFNVRPLELHAAIAREQLKKLPKFIEARRANYDLFTHAVIDNGLPVTLPIPNGDMSPFGLHFTVPSRDVRARLAGALREAGIDCRLPTGGSFRKHVYGAPWRDQQTPNADRIHETGMFLGNAPFDISDKIERAVAVMRETL